jgi:hypothetical protein
MQALQSGTNFSYLKFLIRYLIRQLYFFAIAFILLVCSLNERNYLGCGSSIWTVYKEDIAQNYDHNV